jgi:hypothetical protein
LHVSLRPIQRRVRSSHPFRSIRREHGLELARFDKGAEELAIDGPVSQTAVEAWDQRWATSEGRDDWLEPHPAVVAILPELHPRGARRVLDLGCGVGRHALLPAP